MVIQYVIHIYYIILYHVSIFLYIYIHVYLISRYTVLIKYYVTITYDHVYQSPKHRMLDTTTEVQDGDGVETIHLQQTALRLAAQDLSFEDLSPI